MKKLDYLTYGAMITSLLFIAPLYYFLFRGYDNKNLSDQILIYFSMINGFLACILWVFVNRKEKRSW